MKDKIITVLLVFLAFAKADMSQAQNTSLQPMSAEEVLQKSIAYHDPKGNWPSFDEQLDIILKTPNNSIRKSFVRIDLPNNYFSLTTIKDSIKTFREIKNATCTWIDGEGLITESQIDDNDCERTLMLRDYYTYLYGLPMKLQDPGTILESEVYRETLKGKQYLMLRVTYDEQVGSDIWQFYFNPTTYAMEAYQFFKNDDRTTGEYILLSDTSTIMDIKMPKNRSWYYNKDDGYLGTDILTND